MSKVILYMAISADGFIASENDNVDWVGEDSWKSYLGFVKSCDVVLVGERTFSLMSKDEFLEGPQYIVVTHDPDLDTGKFKKIAINSRADLPAAEKIGVIGGGELNGSIAEVGLIDEVILDVEPILLGRGINLFGSYNPKLPLNLISSQKIGGSTVQNRYEVMR